MQLTVSEDSLVYLFLELLHSVKDSKQAYKSSSQISQRRMRQNKVKRKVVMWPHIWSHINKNWPRHMEVRSRKHLGSNFSFVCTAERCRFLTKWLFTRYQAIKANVSCAWAWCPSPLFLVVPVAAAVWEQDALHISWIQNDLLQLLLPGGILPDLSVPGSHHASPDGRKITKVRSGFASYHILD